MSNTKSQQNQKPQGALKEDQPKKGKKKSEGLGSKPDEYKGNNPGGSEWKNEEKT